MVRRMLISRSESHPRSRKTPSGGRTTAKIILQMSLEWEEQMLVGCHAVGVQCRVGAKSLPCGERHDDGVVS
jgi:hypothetical protein